MKTHLAAAAVCLLLAFACRAQGENLLVVCPDTWRDALWEWTSLRTEQGHAIRVFSPAAPPGDPFPRQAFGLLVVGEGRAAGLAPGSIDASIISRYGPESQIASDAVLAQRLGAEYAARLPFASESDLRGYLARVIRRERVPASEGDNRVLVGAGVGGFSPLIDTAIEGAARRLFRDLAPADALVTLRRFPGPARPHAPTHQRGGVWVWLGHGLRDRLPGIPPERLVATTEGADLAVLIACYAGDFAARGDCVAEQLLRHPEGPIAVIASTRVSMPYGNARLGGELLAALSRRPDGLLGSLVTEAKAGSLADEAAPRLEGLDAIAQLLGAPAGELPGERREHAAMYHLLGDPLAKIRQRRLRETLAEEQGDTRIK